MTNPNDAQGNNLINNSYVKRINYLLQASALVNNFDNNLARLYVKNIIESSKKHLLRHDLSVKRHLCKGCNSFLTVGITANISFMEEYIKSNNIQNKIIWTIISCNICKRTRKYPVIFT